MRSPLHVFVEREGERFLAEMAAEMEEDARFRRRLKWFLRVAVPVYAVFMFGLFRYLFTR